MLIYSVGVGVEFIKIFKGDASYTRLETLLYTEGFLGVPQFVNARIVQVN
jgi:hypothetical protein